MNKSEHQNRHVGLNMDFSQPLFIETTKLLWEKSPMGGVERRKLERQFAETGHTTSIVRYAPKSYFSAHTHSGGEEFYVLEGVFSDDTGNFPRGAYVRNPSGSTHTPYSDEGCTIFVKLCQMQANGEPQINIDTNRGSWQPKETGWFIMPLFENAKETVQLNKLLPNAAFKNGYFIGGLEFLLLEGDFAVNGEGCSQFTWGRFPSTSAVSLASTNGCIFWSKQKHLP